MKHIFSFLKREKIQAEIELIVTRFPLGVLLSLGVTGCIFFLIAYNTDSGSIYTIVSKIVFTGVILFFLSTGVSLFLESLKHTTRLTRILSHVGVLIFGVLYYFGLGIDFGNFQTLTYFMVSLFGIIAFLFFAPYTQNFLSNQDIQNKYFIYFYRVSVVFFISSILGGSLALLGNGAILAVQTLFDISFSSSGDIYAYWTTLALGLCTPLFALAQFPTRTHFEDTQFQENIFFNFLVRYIAIPFITLYFIILYAYSIKVLLNFGDWPKGEVSWMVIMFSIFGYITYIFSYIFEQRNQDTSHAFIVLFRKIFPYIVIPQVGMLFYAIMLRIGQYDITINRYFVVVFGLWLFSLSAYFIVSKLKSLFYIPALLTLFILVISIGPWSVYNLPLSRQLDRLESHLVQANILQGEKIVALSQYDSIDSELSKQIYDGIEYVCNFDGCESLRKLFPEIMQEIDTKDRKDWETNEGQYSYYSTDYYQENKEIKGKYRGVGNWTYIQKITETIKVRSYSDPYDAERQVYYTLNSEAVKNIFPLDTSGYTKLFSLDTYSSDERPPQTNGESSAASSLSVRIDIPAETLLVVENNITVDTVEISAIFSKLRELGKEYETSGIPLEKLVFEASSETYNYKLLVQSAQIHRNKDDAYSKDTGNYMYINGYVLSVKK